MCYKNSVKKQNSILPIASITVLNETRSYKFNCPADTESQRCYFSECIFKTLRGKNYFVTSTKFKVKTFFIRTGEKEELKSYLAINSVVYCI